ncbi:hypothetical protein GN958_ATG03375 [Phytophthora infestans]|uniref:Uncharacterized protein n=1 Tax=Phytophthora infestans TaxID=4787 RepID=A0A8S9V395_PHYIN|nr:hypothetical protein GN958_ATG20518 [Phytophthora infestans]KAF4147420.1 hypothetical protein GN958_ATG03375 [Phytophthora infestans]
MKDTIAQLTEPESCLAASSAQPHAMHVVVNARSHLLEVAVREYDVLRVYAGASSILDLPSHRCESPLSHEQKTLSDDNHMRRYTEENVPRPGRS